MTKKCLERPAVYTERVGDSHFLGSRPSVTYCLWGLLQYTDKKGISLAEVNALAGYAFSLNIFKDTVHIGGPFIYAGEERFQQALANLGYDFKVLNFLPVEPDTVTDVLDTAQRSIDRGVPIILWDIFHAEFGLVYGYDDNKRQLNGLDKLREEPLAYDLIGKGKTAEIGFISITTRNKTDRRTAIIRMLNQAIEHGYTAEPIKHADGELAKGLAAYDAWMEAFQGGRIVSFFNAYNIVVYAELRQFGVQFLRELLEEFQDHEMIEACIRKCVGHYEAVAAALKGLAELFPFPGGGDPKDPDNIINAIKFLEDAKRAEAKGLRELNQLRACIVSLQPGGVE
ncbi:hypothetical protein [Paenibacillus contaminans]|uniref:Butirosin biosynthesis protein H N-terminal domain-containing protein n=1 Tax=Paenibacillus contaminans TaxID=450362 RepID=A0A329MLK7_9BACL|nr:hypothetical protein [Paenibacillus contaminans]RAV20749.1 hypothetical protein DQG23_14705 [Paenibacillus contaminans]